MRKYAAEALGTFSLVFAGTSAIVVNDLSGGAVTHVGVSLTFGLIVRGVMAGLAIGATVALGALLGGPISGASMNPARSLGPAVVSGSLGVMWLYCTAPLLGAGLAVVGCRCVRGVDCCSPSLSSRAA